MQVKLTPSVIDPVPGDMFDAFNAMPSTDHPCQVCAASGTNIRDHYHGSDLGACPRKVAYKMLNPSANRSFNSTSMFLKDGHLHERTIIEALKEHLPEHYVVVAGTDYAEFKWRIGEWFIHCHIDGLLIASDPDTEEQETFLVECKSVKETTWKKVQGGEISDEWYGQIQAYLVGLNLNAAYLCVKHRHTSQLMLPIRIEKDMPYVETRVDGLLEIQAIKTPNQILRPYANAKGTECTFCPFKAECWEE